MTGSTTIGWDAAQFSTSDTRSSARDPWSDFAAVAESELILGLFFRKRIRLIIPKRVLSPPDIAEILGHVRAAGGKA